MMPFIHRRRLTFMRQKLHSAPVQSPDTNSGATSIEISIASDCHSISKIQRSYFPPFRSCLCIARSVGRYFPPIFFFFICSCSCHSFIFLRQAESPGHLPKNKKSDTSWYMVCFPLSAGLSEILIPFPPWRILFIKILEILSQNGKKQ